MAIFSHFSLQKAIYELLSNDISLSALITGVYDKPSENVEFPYVMLGDIAGVDWSSKTTTGMEYTITLNIFSREGGRKQTTEIMERLFLLLHDVDIAVEDQELVMIRFLSSNIFQETDGWTYRGMMRFKIFMYSI